MGKTSPPRILAPEMASFKGGRSIVAEIMIETLTHTIVARLPVVGIIIALVRMGLREGTIRPQINAKIAEGIRVSLRDLESTRTAFIRQEIRNDFTSLKQKITSSIDEEIALIDGSLEAILARKREGEQRAEQERHRFDEARTRLTDIADRIRPLLA